MKSFAQFNEDKFIYDIFKKKNISSGIFVEFGAWDGVHFSNCKILADNNWSGFFIEANKIEYNKILNNINALGDVKIKDPIKDYLIKTEKIFGIS